MPRKNPNKTDAERAEDKRRHQEKMLKSMKDLLEARKIDSFEHLFSFFKQTNLAKAIHMGQGTIRKRAEDPKSFKASEISAIADLIGVSHDVIHEFWRDQISKAEKKRQS